MIDRWATRVEPSPGQGKLYWHILLNRFPAAKTLASTAHERLSAFPGLHFTPQEWLHITTLVIGFSEDFSSAEIDRVIASARKLLSGLSPISISLGKLLYHPEAIAVAVRPRDSLDVVQDSVWRATRQVVGEERILNDQSWNPHFTVAYSTAVQSARPIISALGRDLPACEVTIDAVDLVVQEGPERQWNWTRLARIPFGAGEAQQ
jgi:2'-5' RNA ligase